MEEWRKRHNAELSNNYNIPDIVNYIKKKKSKWSGYIRLCVEEIRGSGKNSSTKESKMEKNLKKSSTALGEGCQERCCKSLSICGLAFTSTKSR